MTKKKRIVWIDQLRGLAFYTVILGHMSIVYGLKSLIYSFHMPLFFMISGLNLNIEKIYNTKFKNYSLRLAKKMLVPYFWLQMLSFLLRQLVSVIRNKPFDVKTYLLGILVGNNNLVEAPSNPLYYVLLLFLAQIGLWFVIKLAKCNKKYITIGVAGFSLISLCLQRISLPWHINVVPMAMLLIFIGRLLMDLYIKVKDKLETMKKWRYFGLCGAFGCFGFILNRINGRISIHGNYYGKNVILFLACAVAISIAIALVVMLLPQIRLLSFIGENTFFYMGIHKPLLLVFGAIVGSLYANPIYIIIGSLVCFFGLIPVAWIFNKFMPYICGKSLKQETLSTSIFKFVAIFSALVIPYYMLTERIIADNTTIGILTYFIFIGIVVVIERLFTKLIPFMFLKEKQ